MLIPVTMQPVKIAIVENEVIIADSICATLTDLGYNVLEPCSTYKEAVALLKEDAPDIAIIDIHLGDDDGVDVARYIKEQLNIPFIFLTANTDTTTVNRARAVNPDAYLSKPFKKTDLFAAIEVAIYNARETPLAGLKPLSKQKDHIFIKDGDYFVKVKLDEILYLSSEHVYVTVHTLQRKFLVRSSLQDYLKKFDPEKFIRVHRSYAVNVEKIEKMNAAYIVINGQEVPISKNYRDILSDQLDIN